jgi:hypothetical protein
MRTKKRCSAEQFDLATRGRQFTSERLAAARRVMVDGETANDVASSSTVPVNSIRQAVRIIFSAVEAQFATVNPSRAPRPGYVILTVEVPELAAVGLVAGVASGGGIILEERRA